MQLGVTREATVRVHFLLWQLMCDHVFLVIVLPNMYVHTYCTDMAVPPV